MSVYSIYSVAYRVASMSNPIKSKIEEIISILVKVESPSVSSAGSVLGKRKKDQQKRVRNATKYKAILESLLYKWYPNGVSQYDDEAILPVLSREFKHYELLKLDFIKSTFEDEASRRSVAQLLYGISSSASVLVRKGASFELEYDPATLELPIGESDKSESIDKVDGDAKVPKKSKGGRPRKNPLPTSSATESTTISA